MNENEIRQVYAEVFKTPAGQRVLEDLERVANGTKIDGAEPNANAAIYKTAQLSLVQYIKKRTTEPKKVRYIETN